MSRCLTILALVFTLHRSVATPAEAQTRILESSTNLATWTTAYVTNTVTGPEFLRVRIPNAPAMTSKFGQIITVSITKTATLNWSNLVNCASISGVVVERSSPDTNNWQTLAIVTNCMSSLVLSNGLVAGWTNAFRVREFNSGGTGAASNVAILLP